MWHKGGGGGAYGQGPPFSSETKSGWPQARGWRWSRGNRTRVGTRGPPDWRAPTWREPHRQPSGRLGQGGDAASVPFAAGRGQSVGQREVAWFPLPVQNQPAFLQAKRQGGGTSPPQFCGESPTGQRAGGRCDGDEAVRDGEKGSGLRAGRRPGIPAFSRPGSGVGGPGAERVVSSASGFRGGTGASWPLT